MPPSEQQIREFYQEFSLAVGMRDWLRSNPRHQRLKVNMDRLLAGRRGLHLLDVGCGAGAMTACLRRYGRVWATDFSDAAISLARELLPDVTFYCGSLEVLPAGARWDVITLFDVLEHIPGAHRAQFLGGVHDRLRSGGLLVVSTPYPEFTRWRRKYEVDTLQMVDEAVDLRPLLAEVEEAGLQLLRYEAYDVWRGSPEYQFMVFTTAREPGGPPVLRAARRYRRLRVLRPPGAQGLRRAVHALRLVRYRSSWPRIWWLLTGRAPDVKS